jgi:hypothetical protein
MVNQNLWRDTRLALIGSKPEPVSDIIKTGSDNVKAEFGRTSKLHYASVLHELRHLGEKHNLQAVLEAVKQDLGLQ